MRSLIQEIAKKYSLQDIEEKLSGLSYNLTLSIGFLGEFSSGKSTLINALLGKKILPAMERPTTKSIVEIIPDSSTDSVEFYERDDNGEIIPLKPMDFQEIALGKRDGIGILKVKTSDIFQDGYVVIDTPGISSLDKTDVNITYKYLPRLDGAVICQDINFGSLTDSIMKFLLLPSVKPIINNFIFALTKSDTKEESTAIKENIVKLLIDNSEKLGLNINNIEERVISVSGLKALETNDSSYIEEFKTAFNRVILNRKKSMLKAKETKELNALAENTIQILNDIKNNLNFTDDELVQKEEEIKQEIKQLESDKREFYEKLEKYKDRLCSSLDKIAERYIPLFESIKASEDVETAINEFTTEILEKAKLQTKSFMDGVEIPNLSYVSGKLKASIQNSIKMIDMGTLIATAAITTIIFPPAGLTAGAEEVAGATLFKTAKDIGRTAKVIGVINKAKDATKEAADKTGKESTIGKILGGLGSVLEVVGTIANKVNPVEYVGDYIKQLILSGKAKTELYRMSSYICSEVTDEVESKVDELIFSNIDKEMKSKETAIRSIKQEKLNKAEHLNKTKEEIEQAIQSLKNNIRADSNSND